MKTKFGLSTTVYTAGVFFLALFGGYTPLLIAAGYALVAEEDLWLKKTVVKAVMMQVCFSILFLLIGAIPTVLELMRDVVTLFNGNFTYAIVIRLQNIAVDVADIIRDVFFVLAAFLALKGKSLGIGFIDSFVEKHFA
ncbi:MAG: hypothetical protein K6G60_07455 [Lachnospiraceae bacterium]|nr:hypothetical protein [Lachnospiraceae bacterium]